MIIKKIKGEFSMKTLFIGNSHTYFNHMPRMFTELCILKGIDMHSTMLAHPGWRLSQHLEEPEVYFNVVFGEYDFVVIQQAAHPFPGEESLLDEGGRLCDMIRKGSASPCVYMTWPEKLYPENRDPMREAYIKLSNQTGAALCSVGDAWKIAQESGMDLYYNDGEHANQLGSYLAACVFLRMLTHEDPRGLPGTLYFNNEVLCEIEDKTARLLQNSAVVVSSI
jgi:hypothetical protein